MSLWTDLLDLQDGRCGMCGETPSLGDRLIEDHDHRTGLIRGLLCRSCNTLEGAHDCRAQQCLPGQCRVRHWRDTPAVAWLGRTERFEGWHRGEELFRDWPFLTAAQRVELADEQFRRQAAAIERMFPDDKAVAS